MKFRYEKSKNTVWLLKNHYTSMSEDVTSTIYITIIHSKIKLPFLFYKQYVVKCYKVCYNDKKFCG